MLKMNIDGLLTKCDEMKSGGLYINIDANTHDINLKFVDSRNENELTLKCKGVHIYRIVRDPLPDEPPYFIGEVTIKTGKIREIIAQDWHFPQDSLPDIGWIVDITGAAYIRIVCLELIEESA